MFISLVYRSVLDLFVHAIGIVCWVALVLCDVLWHCHQILVGLFDFRNENTLNSTEIRANVFARSESRCDALKWLLWMGVLWIWCSVSMCTRHVYALIILMDLYWCNRTKTTQSMLFIGAQELLQSNYMRWFEKHHENRHELLFSK